MEKEYGSSIEEIISTYDAVVKVLDTDAQESDRAYGGVVRSTKGRLQEYITHSLILIAWREIGGKGSDIEINSKKIKIPIKKEYIEKIDDPEVKGHLVENIVDYYYSLSVDKHIFIKDKFVMGIECKAYTENAMIKRILVDFDLLASIQKDLKCFLFQLESQLGGDYSNLSGKTYGSKPTHTIMSYFNCDLNIITLIKGERDVDRPIHKYYKPLERDQLIKAKDILKDNLKSAL